MRRRDVFPIVGAAAAAGGYAAPAPDAYTPRALQPAEYAVLREVANLVLPADDVSPGAGDAGATQYIDTLLHHGPAAARESFRKDLRPLVGLSGEALDAALSRLAAEEANAASFFARLKPMVIDAYCLSPEGRRFLRYSGDRAVAEFTGCDHPEHRKA